MMRIHEIQGLTAVQKGVLAAKFEPRFENGPPFEDDKPTHTITLEGLNERRAAISGILACDNARPNLHLLNRAGPVLLELQVRRSIDYVTLSASRLPDEVALTSMYWAAHYAGNLGSLTLAGIAERDSDTKRLTDFIGGEDEFTSGLAVVQDLVGGMKEVGLLAEIDPDHVANLPWPEPGRANFFVESVRAAAESMRARHNPQA
jgi:hypothetical protein